MVDTVTGYVWYGYILWAQPILSITNNPQREEPIGSRHSVSAARQE